jgi:hypothetical protein
MLQLTLQMQNTNALPRNFECQKVQWPFPLPVFLGQPIVFILNNHFFQTPHSIDNDFSLIHPCGSN